MNNTWYVEIVHTNPECGLITGSIDCPTQVRDAYGVFLHLMFADSGVQVPFVMLKNEEGDGIIAIRSEDISVVNIHQIAND